MGEKQFLVLTLMLELMTTETYDTGKSEGGFPVLWDIEPIPASSLEDRLLAALTAWIEERG